MDPRSRASAERARDRPSRVGSRASWALMKSRSSSIAAKSAALTLGGAHGIFKTSRLEQLFRDGALRPLHPPPSDFCLHNIGLYELGIHPADVLPPLKPG